MCSLNDYRCSSNDNVPCDNAKDSLIDTTLCRKCRSKEVDVLLIGHSGYCKICFLTVTNHKFRSALGKSKIIRHGDTILIDHSGKLNSTVLLHLIKSGMNESVHKKLIFKPIILYIDDDAIIGKTNEERDILRHKIAEEIKEYGFDGYFVSLSQALSKEDALSINPVDSQEIITNHETEEQLHRLLTSLRDNTSRIDLLCQLRRKLLISAARKMNCNKIFVADSAMNIATRVLGDICLGRGAQLSSLAAFCDSRCPDIKILKPLRDFTKQELDFYAQYHNLNPIELRQTDVSSSTSSIQALAHNFVEGLESQFSGTVSAIFRTAEKLSAKNEHQDMEDNCVMCDAKLNSVSSGDGISALRAIEVSKLVSHEYIDKGTSLNNIGNGRPDRASLQSNSEDCCNDNDMCNCKDSKKRQVTREDIWTCLCHSCKMIFQNSDISRILPSSILCAIQQRLTLKSMRKEISDFLL